LSGSLPGRRARVRLLAAAAVVALLAACGEGHSGDRSATPPRDAVAVVNGQAITRSDFERFVESAAGTDETASGGGEARRRLFVRMVDEELLIQRAVALGLHRRDPAARHAILSAMVASVTSAADAGEPDEAALRGEVRNAYLRQQREQALRDTLSALRRDADVRVLDPELVAPSAPAPRGDAATSP
jgi:hypothetical protein